MPYTEGSLTSADGLRLRTQRRRPDGPARAGVVIVHGHGEHCGRYAHVGERRCGARYVVVGTDASRSFFERAASADKALRTCPGLYHELCDETEREHVPADIVAWLDARA